MYKDLISGSDTKVKLENGNYIDYINFDNAATTPSFYSVINDMVHFSKNYSSVHRGAGYKSILSSEVYEDARDTVLEFVGGNKNSHTVVFLKNTTECINKLSYRLKHELKDKVVLSTYMEHHSNLLPWKFRYDTNFIEVDAHGRLCIEDLEFKLNLYRGKVGLVAVTGASNATGYKNPIYEIAKICHKYGAKILVDGAQLIPHSPFEMKPMDSEEHIDYIAFSAHKMYAPFGTGVLVAPKCTFKEGFPEQLGGGIVDFVSIDETIWLEPPQKEEAGTPNLMGVIALISSIKTLNKLGMNNIEEYERDLTRYALTLIKSIPSIKLYDDMNLDEKVSIISFNIENLHHGTLANMLSKEGGIAVRNGCFCAQPYVQRLLNIPNDEMKKYKKNPRLPRPGMVRISFGLYNDYDEIYLLYHLLNKIANNVDYFKYKYKNAPLY